MDLTKFWNYSMKDTIKVQFCNYVQISTPSVTFVPNHMPYLCEITKVFISIAYDEWTGRTFWNSFISCMKTNKIFQLLGLMIFFTPDITVCTRGQGQEAPKKNSGVQRLSLLSAINFKFWPKIERKSAILGPFFTNYFVLAINF